MAKLVSFTGNKKWKCVVCEKMKNDGLLHLVCHGCKQEVCMDCSNELKLFDVKVEKKDPEVMQTNYLCKKGHSLVKTTKAPDLGTLRFLCNSCNTNFYINTPNYYCQQCNYRCCDLCGFQVLKKSSTGTCFKGHPLVQQENNIGIYIPCKTNPNHVIVWGTPIYVCGSGCDYQTCHPDKCL